MDDAPTPAERAWDPLMCMMADQALGDDNANRRLLRALRLERIDRILEAMKAQGLLPEVTLIDRPLQRAAFQALIAPLYEPHYAHFAGVYPGTGRHGRDGSDLYFAALTDHMCEHGFTPEASAAFSNWDDAARAAHERFADRGWGKISEDPPHVADRKSVV